MITTSPITPTIGRIVYVHVVSQLGVRAQAVPAIVNTVHDDPNVVGVTVLPSRMPPFSIPNLPYAEPEGDEPMPEHGWWWMSYQRQNAGVVQLQGYGAGTVSTDNSAPQGVVDTSADPASMDNNAAPDVTEASSGSAGKPAKAKGSDADTAAPEEPSTASSPRPSHA